MNQAAKIKKVTRPILKRHGIAMAYLFGSHARGSAGAMSDIDIAVLTQDGVRFDRIENQLFHNLAIELKTDNIDLVNIRTASPLLAHRAVIRGAAILPHDRHREALLKTSIIHRYEDHRHFYDIKQRAVM